jgi:hypothetical protein
MTCPDHGNKYSVLRNGNPTPHHVHELVVDMGIGRTTYAEFEDFIFT